VIAAIEFIIHFTLIFMLALSVLVLSALISPYAMRRIWGFMSDRYGPNRVGPMGLLQPFADGLKLFIKEDLTPTNANRWLFLMAPAITFITPMLTVMVIPFSPGYTIANLNVGLLYLVAVGSFSILGLLLAGWASHNKYSLLGGLRSVAQMVSYEIPMILNVIIIAMLVGSLSLNDVVNSQDSVWYIAVQPLAFLVFLIAGMAELNRTPFDLPEAESELVSGYLTEYGGLRFALFAAFIEWGEVTVWSMTCVAMFLGGWHGPFGGSAVWLVLKVLVLVFVVIWIYATFPRLQVDQLMAFCWKILIPISLFNIFVTGLLIIMMPDNFMLPMAIFSWVSVILLVVLFPSVMKKSLLRKRLKRFAKLEPETTNA
jgi:NADH-quinone oxidoreductase subunit H